MIIGGGPGASEDIGGQWNTTARHRGVWPGMLTNTSKTTTVFSDLAHTEEIPMIPSASQIGLLEMLPEQPVCSPKVTAALSFDY